MENASSINEKMTGDQRKWSNSQRLQLLEAVLEEIDSLTKSHLFLASEKPHVVCKAADTKNSKIARQYILPDLAAALVHLVAGKVPKAKVFNECLHDVKLKFHGEKVSDLMPAAIGNLYAGQQLVMFGHYTGHGEVEMEFRGS